MIPFTFILCFTAPFIAGWLFGRSQVDPKRDPDHYSKWGL